MIQAGSFAELTLERPTQLTVGSFDGVHLGHQSLIRDLVARAHAQDTLAAVVTFYPHPAEVLRGPRPAFYLTSPAEKAALFEGLGVDVLVTHPFNVEVSQLTAQQFVDLMQAALHFKEIWGGADFAFGHNREGTLTWLNQHGYNTRMIEPLSLGGEPISSSRIRRALAEGDVTQAKVCLGRPFKLAGIVVQGNQRGRTIGIPTANLGISADRAFPAKGVYACRAWVNGKPVEAVTNIGVRPTFGGDTQPTIEAHLLDFSADLYGQTIQLDFLSRLRAEQKFNGIQELIAQIHADIAQARAIFMNMQSKSPESANASNA